MRLPIARRSFSVGVLLVVAGVMVPSVTAQQRGGRREPETAATRQYAAAVALQNREVYDLASQEWTKYLDRYGDDSLPTKHN